MVNVKKNAAKTRKLLYLSEFFFLCGSQIVQGQPAQHRQGLHKDIVTNKQQSNEYRVCHEAYVSQ